MIVLNLDLLNELHDEIKENGTECSFTSVPWYALIVKDIDSNELWFQDTTSLA